MTITKQQFTNAGGTETGRYKVSRETDAGGNAKYTRTNLDSGTQEVIGENVFRKGKIKSYIQTDPPNQAKHLDAPEIEPNIVTKAVTPDGHTIKIAKTGDIGICSECTDLREEFAEELVDNAELDEKLDSICAETDPKQKALLAAEFRQKLLAERWKRNPFREDQLTRRTVGDVEYLDLQLDDGRKVTLKKDADGNWKVERWSGGSPTMMDAEVLGRMPGGNGLPLLSEVRVSSLYQKIAHETGINEISLGVNKQGELEGFTEKVKSWIYKNWDKVGLYDPSKGYGWGRSFYDSLYACIANRGKINFNLDGLDITAALSAEDYMTWVGRYTAWELQQVVRNPIFLDNTNFYLNGKILNNEDLLKLGIKPYPPLTTEELKINGLID